MTAAKKEQYVCSFCKGSAIEGIHFPSDFSDREPCKDGKVFVAKCDECDKYSSDTEAAEVVAKMFGWKVRRSMDKKDDTSLKARREAKNKSWYRPFFEVTLEEAIAAHQREPKVSSVKAEARHGNVLLSGELLKPLSRDEAADLLVSIASAIQHAGDISEPRAVFLHKEVYLLVQDFKKEGA